jgi:hypothetical protein
VLALTAEKLGTTQNMRFVCLPSGSSFELRDGVVLDAPLHCVLSELSWSDCGKGELLRAS